MRLRGERAATNEIERAARRGGPAICAGKPARGRPALNPVLSGGLPASKQVKTQLSRGSRGDASHRKITYLYSHALCYVSSCAPCRGGAFGRLESWRGPGRHDSARIGPDGRL